MRFIPWNELVPGERYYIEASTPLPGCSGKQIGTFHSFVYPTGPIPDLALPALAQFTDLTDIQRTAIGPAMPSCFGTATTNDFSTSYFRFYLPEADTLYDRSIRRQAMAQIIDYQGKRHTIPRTSLPANPRTSIGIDLARGSFGGPYRKSRKSRRSKKSKSRKSRS
jgi:hypothetical protein